MHTNKLIVFMMLSLFLIIQLIGCSQEKEKISANQIAPVNIDEISVFTINHGNLFTKEFNDKKQIETILDFLGKIEFSKMSVEQEKELLEDGRVFNKDTTLSIQLLKLVGNNQVQSKADITIISEMKLILVDSETSQERRTISYLNQDDEASLNAVKAIYALAKKAME